MPGPGSLRPMGAFEWSLLLILSVIWGGSFFFNEVAVAAIPPFSVVAGRVALAALALWAVTRVLGSGMPADPRIWAAFLVLGVVNNAIPFSLIVWGQSHVASGVASILNATTPLFGVLVAHAATRDERLTRLKLAGVLAGIAGVATMIGGAAVRDLGSDVLAQVAILGAALAYALGGVYGRSFRALGVTPLQTATGQVTGSALVMLPAAAFVDRTWTLAAPGWPAIAAVAALALVCTAAAYLIYFRILQSSGAVNLLLVTLLVPVTAILLGVAFLGESLAPRHVIGLAAIAAGLAAIDGRPVLWLRRRPRSGPAKGWVPLRRPRP